MYYNKIISELSEYSKEKIDDRSNCLIPWYVKSPKCMFEGYILIGICQSKSIGIEATSIRISFEFIIWNIFQREKIFEKKRGQEVFQNLTRNKIFNMSIGICIDTFFCLICINNKNRREGICTRTLNKPFFMTWM